LINDVFAKQFRDNPTVKLIGAIEFIKLLLFSIEQNNEHVLATEDAQFDGFLQEASLPFAEGNVSMVSIFYHFKWK
jgi:hypothetical protein